jgi:hypothetical protein
LFDLKSEYDDIVNNISLKDKPEEIQKSNLEKKKKTLSAYQFCPGGRKNFPMKNN